MEWIMERTILNGEWKLQGRSERIGGDWLQLTATVPGCAQLELAKAGILPEDLFMGENMRLLQPYEEWEWKYEREFDGPKSKENLFLVFEGVDCIAEYYLNGIYLGKSDNMMIPFECYVGDKISGGKNKLSVHIKSPIGQAFYTDYDVLNIRSAWYEESSPIRKPPHVYGWDVMPRAVTAGIWRDVYLENRDKLYFKQTYITQKENYYIFSFEIAGTWADFQDICVEVEGCCGESKFYAQKKIPFNKGNIVFTIDNPKLWWPNGYGEANVYYVVYKIYKSDRLVHTKNSSLGIRTVVFEDSYITDGENGHFRFIINGKEIMCKGTNWLPIDPFHCRDKERYKEALPLLKDVGCNIVRCWGGNLYEDSEFFDYCDRNGIMVWQDFSFACYANPQNTEFLEKVRKEVVSVVRKLRQHPSLVLWCGDNEVDYAYIENGKLPSANKISRAIIPEVLFANDFNRPYMASSAYHPDEVLLNPNLTLSECHLWIRDFYKSPIHMEYKAHFLGEIGWPSCPSVESMKKFIRPEQLWDYRNKPDWNLHTGEWGGGDGQVNVLIGQMQRLFGEVPGNLEDFVLASQISQAEAFKFTIEHIRIHRPNKTGIIIWNLLDGWPQISHGLVDYYFNKKLAYYYVQRSMKPFIIALSEYKDGKRNVVACNDTLVSKKGRCCIYDAETKETVFSSDFSVGENGAFDIGFVDVSDEKQRLLIIEWEINDESGFNHYLCGKQPISLEKYKSYRIILKDN